MNLDQDLTFARVAGDQMDDYVHAEVLFYPIGSVGGIQMPQLSIGAWLETEWRLKAVRNTDNATRIDPVLQAAQAEIREVRSRSPDLYQTKARREFRSRLDSWEMFVDDYTSGESTAGYPSTVHMRFKLELLKDETSQPNDQLLRLQALDDHLRVKFVSGPFVWEPELAAAAPKDRFWFLYGV